MNEYALGEILDVYAEDGWRIGRVMEKNDGMSVVYFEKSTGPARGPGRVGLSPQAPNCHRAPYNICFNKYFKKGPIFLAVLWPISEIMKRA